MNNLIVATKNCQVQEEQLYINLFPHTLDWSLSPFHNKMHWSAKLDAWMLAIWNSYYLKGVHQKLQEEQLYINLFPHIPELSLSSFHNGDAFISLKSDEF